jgi:glycosyltransferase involved in cell wall biosynthesis
VNPEAGKINLMLSIAGLHHGGAERVIASLCRHLDPDRYAITVCWRTARGEIGEELRAQGFEIVGLPEIHPDVSPYLRFLVLRKLLKKLRIDVIHTHDTGSLADAAQCRILGSKLKIVHTFHFGNYPNLKKSYLYMELVFSRFAHRLIAVGHEQAKLVRRSLRLDESRLSTLYNGVENASIDTNCDYVASYRNKLEKPVVIGSISTLTNQKGLFVLLDAAAILRDKGANSVFFIAGDGPLRAELERKTHQLGLEHVVNFLGWVPNAAEKLLHSLDVFCQSSLWEANSIVLLEAMASGLPIVTTNVGESRHVIEQDHNGLIVKPGDPEGLAEALARMIDDRELRESMGRLAREKFKKTYTVDKMVENYESVYEDLVNN